MLAKVDDSFDGIPEVINIDHFQGRPVHAERLNDYFSIFRQPGTHRRLWRTSWRCHWESHGQHWGFGRICFFSTNIVGKTNLFPLLSLTLLKVCKKNLNFKFTQVSGLIAGVMFGLFSGQPLTILGLTGPDLVFESLVMIWNICILKERKKAPRYSWPHLTRPGKNS